MDTIIQRTKVHGMRLRTEILVFFLGFVIYGLSAWMLGFNSSWNGEMPTAWGLFLLGTKNCATKMIFLSIAIVFAHFSRKAIFYGTDLSGMLYGEGKAKSVPSSVRAAAVFGTYLYYFGVMIAFAMMM